MSGKRLLDAARLLGAARAVAKSHAEIRSQQWDTFTKTSQLAKGVKNQTDRFTVTAGAAYELAKRLSERGPPTAPSQPDIRSEHGYGNTTGSRAGSSGVNGDVHVKRPVASNTGLDDSGTSDLRFVQADAALDSLPDGTIQSRSSTLVDNLDANNVSRNAREAQRRSEGQIPSVTAEDTADTDHAHQETFSRRTGSTGPGLSSLPRVKIPKATSVDQGISDTANDGQLNQDVFYNHDRSAASEEGQSTRQTASDIDTNVFHTSHGASLAGLSSAQDRRRAYEKRMRDVGRGPRNATWTAEGPESTESVKTATPNTTVTKSEPATQRLDDRISLDDQKLAEALMEDISTSQTAAPESTQGSFALHQSSVPSSRFGRLWQYSGLATSMAFGALGEGVRRMTGRGEVGQSLVLSEANMNRLVAKLSRMRGAALKLGQMMSFQDSKMLPPAIHAVLARVQDSADYMPTRQRDQVLLGNLGPDWRDLFVEFNDIPIAAASIGQVHRATLASTGQPVAVKIQYPGVAASIDSDLNNLSLLLTASRLLPKGLYLDKTIANARTELAWECDYTREAACAKRFADLVADESSFVVPRVIDQASGPSVLTAEFMSGVAVTKVPDLSQDERDWIGTQILRLCLRELVEWRFMQTDPNWTNFLYERGSGPGTGTDGDHTGPKLQLLDFGASRDFSPGFVDPYVELLVAASKGRRDDCRHLSIQLGYLTGSESKEMLDAHVASIMTLAEPFLETGLSTGLDHTYGRTEGVYDFKNQTITDRVRANIGVMVRERQAPPPEETYSLHRKLSGAFLLCAKLGSRVRTRDMFVDAVHKWQQTRH